MKALTTTLAALLTTAAMASEPAVVTNHCAQIETLNMALVAEHLNKVANDHGLIDCQFTMETMENGLVGVNLTQNDGKTFGILLGQFPEAVPHSSLKCEEENSKSVITYSVADAIGWFNVKMEVLGSRVWGITLNRTIPLGQVIDGVTCYAGE